MKKSIVILCFFCVVAAVPVPEGHTNALELLKIPLKGDKELDILTLGEQDGSLKERNKRTIGVLRELFPHLSKVIDNEGDAQIQEVDEAGLMDLIRVVRESPQSENSIEPQKATDDQKPAASQNTDVDELSLDGKDDEEDRNKRFLSFNGSSGSSSGGGSGNFLFDIIRRTADRFARTAGRVYRVAAGTETFDDHLEKPSQKTENDRTARANSNGDSLLVSGSSGTEQTDEEQNAPDDEHEEGKGDGYTEGIPGPVTRLFVLANRGLSNLIQDLILRVAQTSERLVNFKARLITSLI